MYHFRIRDARQLAELRTDGQGIATRTRRGEVYHFRSLIEAQELARRFAARRLLR